MESKNDIKKRMVSVAAKAWGIANKDIPKIDPLIPLLLDACASEIVKVSSSIMGTHDKMGNKMMELLTPEELTSPFPARAILYASPLDPSSEINENNEFYYNKSNFNEDESKDTEIYFTPTTNKRLIKGDVCYIANSKNIFKILDPFERENFCKANKKNTSGSDYLWIGLQIPNSITSLDAISFYFDFDMDGVSETQEDIFYQALSTSNWELDGNELKTVNGLLTDGNKSLKKLPNFPAFEFNKSKSICNHVNNFYKRKFITISEDESKSTDYKNFVKTYPKTFTGIFNGKTLEEMEDKLLWIKINFAHYVPSEILDEVNCSINCFPVINRREEKVFITGNEKIKGMEAEEHEIYFDLKNISAEENMEVVLERKKSVNEERKAVLTLRQDNIGRFNSKNAYEAIHQLIDVYREEHAAFSGIKSINHEAIDSLNDAIRPFENVIYETKKSSDGNMPYLLLKTEPGKGNVNVEVDYWLTNGSFANNIEKEEAFRYDSAELTKNKIFLMTTTYGGENKKENEELIHDFRYSLLSRDRIVTKADIKALCYKVFENAIETVTVQEGVSTATLPGSGLRRTIEISIKLNNKMNLKKDEIKFLKEDLKTQLEEKSLNILPFRVLIE
ncbi:MAG: hypothetical protein DRJ05_20400 [Bacteroidetes bacterium]|nr:MAG: hypothetical protein DRJ05_20400 [Bacteroidota bacterium]